jgi:hypothetical protein
MGDTMSRLSPPADHRRKLRETGPKGSSDLALELATAVHYTYDL